MTKGILRLAAVLIIPCLLLDPAWASLAQAGRPYPSAHKTFQEQALSPLTYVSSRFFGSIPLHIQNLVIGEWRGQPHLNVAALVFLAIPLMPAALPSASAQDAPTKIVLRADPLNGLWDDSYQQIPVTELILILNTTAIPGQTSVFDQAFAWLKKLQPGLTEKEFYDRLDKYTYADLRAFLTVCLRSDDLGTLERSRMERSLRSTRDILRSPDFRKAQAAVSSRVFAAYPPANPTVEMYVIWQMDPVMRQTVLNTVLSVEFLEFQRFLARRYDIHPSNNLALVAGKYLQPDTLKRMRDPVAVEAFRMLKKAFPRSGFTRIESLDLITAVPFQPRERPVDSWDAFAQRLRTRAGKQQYAENLDRLSKQWDVILATYRLPVYGVADYMAFFHSAFDTRLDLSAMEYGGTIYRYYQQHYPQRLARYGRTADLFFLDGFYPEVVKPLKDLQIPVDYLDRWLKLFHTDLGRINIEKDKNIQALIRRAYQADPWSNLAFVAHVQNLFKQYPGLEAFMRDEFNITPSRVYATALAITNAFNQPGFRELNDALARWRPLRTPEFDASNAPLKVRLLEQAYQLRQSGIGLVITDDYAGRTIHHTLFEGFEGQFLNLLLSQFQNGKAAEICTVLRDRWGVSSIDLADLFNLLANPQHAAYILDPVNSDRLRELHQTYQFEELAGDQLPLTLKSLLVNGRYALDHYDYLKAPEVRERLVKYSDGFLTLEGTNRVSLFLMTRNELLKDKVYADPLFGRLEAALRALGLSDDEIGEWIRTFTETVPVKAVVDFLENPQSADRFKALQAFYAAQYGSTSAAVTDRYLLALRFLRMGQDFDLIFGALPGVAAFGIDTVNMTSISAIHEQLLKHPQLAEHLRDGEFLKFARSVSDRFYGGAADLETLTELSELYAKVGERPATAINLFSNQFNELLRYLRTRFGITYLAPSTLAPLAQVAENFQAKRMEDFLGRIRRHQPNVSSNDLVLLAEILNRPELVRTATDRNALERLVQAELAAKPPMPRQRLDLVTIMDAERQAFWTAGNANGVLANDREIQVYSSRYSERPDIRKLPTLHLMRLHLVANALKDPDVLHDLGDIVSRDLQDLTTEYGGVVTLRDGHLRFAEGVSYSEDNDRFSTRKYDYFLEGIAHFHLHAFPDSREFAGPSGWVGSRDGDMAYAARYNNAGLLITWLGDVEDPAGNKDRKLREINVDLYTPDGVIDMGNYLVPSTSGNPPAGKPAAWKSMVGRLPAIFFGIFFSSVALAQAAPVTSRIESTQGYEDLIKGLVVSVVMWGAAQLVAVIMPARKSSTHLSGSA